MSTIPSIVAVLTTLLGGAVGAYLLAPALRAVTSSRVSSFAATSTSNENQSVQTFQSIQYMEEQPIIINIHHRHHQNNNHNNNNNIEPNCIKKAPSDDAVLLSLIVPAYNEEQRLPSMLQHTLQCLAHLKQDIIQICHDALQNHHHTSNNCTIIEVIIVNDGSTDQTIASTKQVLENMIQNKQLDSCPAIHIRFITLLQNKGKGAAVQIGMIQSHGKLCLMLDADGATDFSTGILLLGRKLISMSQQQQQHLLSPSRPARRLSVYGSRAHLQENKQQIQRSWIRIILMHGFHFFVRTLCSEKIKDTQCGFKLFTRSAAQILFKNLHLHRWAFDIELVVLSEMLNIPVEEVGVSWQEVDGSKLATSKVALVRASIDMLRDMICVRLCYSLGIWKIRQEEEDEEDE